MSMYICSVGIGFGVGSMCRIGSVEGRVICTCYMHQLWQAVDAVPPYSSPDVLRYCTLGVSLYSKGPHVLYSLVSAEQLKFSCSTVWLIL